MIDSLQVERFRGVARAELSGLTPLTVLVGKNGAGKSTLLDALFIGAHASPADAVGWVVRRRGPTRRAARWLFPRGLAGHGPVELVAGQWRTTLAAWPEEKGARYAHDHGVDDTVPRPWTVIACTRRLGDAPGGMEIALLADDGGSTKVALGPMPPAMHARLIDARLDERPLHDVYSQARQQGTARRVLELVREVVPTVDAIEILTDGDDARLHLAFPDRAVPLDLAGDGVRRLVQIALELGVLPDGGLALLEEPEAHQHPAAARLGAQAIAAAVRQGKQVIVSTHSLELVDALVEAAADHLADLSVIRVALRDDRLLTSHYAGPLVRTTRVDIGEDLR